jgi:uroporphyrinogen-III synthase
VLTSVNGVYAVWERMAALQISKLPQQLKVAAIGPKTAAALTAEGVPPDFVPKEYIAEAILNGLGNLTGQLVLLLRADIARPALHQAISLAGGVAHEVSVYTTQPAQPDPQALLTLHQGVDVITFTSSSTVRNFVSLVRQSGLNPLLLPGKPLLACIGPVTAGTAVEEGLPIHLIAKEYTTDGLIKALLEFDTKEIIR